eukprot:Rmarinus@m.21547
MAPAVAPAEGAKQNSLKENLIYIEFHDSQVVLEPGVETSLGTNYLCNVTAESVELAHLEGQLEKLNRSQKVQQRARKWRADTEVLRRKPTETHVGAEGPLHVDQISDDVKETMAERLAELEERRFLLKEKVRAQRKDLARREKWRRKHDLALRNFWRDNYSKEARLKQFKAKLEAKAQEAAEQKKREEAARLKAEELHASQRSLSARESRSRRRHVAIMDPNGPQRAEALRSRRSSTASNQSPPDKSEGGGARRPPRR